MVAKNSSKNIQFKCCTMINGIEHDFENAKNTKHKSKTNWRQ